MPVDVGLKKEGRIYQREQYAKGGIGVAYWDYRDRSAFRYVRGETILDIGCGEGITLEKLMRAFPEKQIIGIDAEPENIEICRQRGLPIVPGNIYHFPFTDASVDCVLFLDVIEHLSEPKKALAEIKRILRPGGRLIIIFPNDVMFKIARIMTGMIREAFYDSGHVMQWAPGKARRSLHALGFSIVAAHNLPFMLWPVSLHHLCVADKDIGSNVTT